MNERVPQLTAVQGVDTVTASVRRAVLGEVHSGSVRLNGI